MTLRPSCLALLLCIGVLVPVAAAPAPLPWLQRRLIVVIWERRAPETLSGAGAYGSVQRANREALVSLVYDSGLAGPPEEQRHASIAVYPEGMPSHDPNAERWYASLGDTAPEQLADVWLPRMLSIGESDESGDTPTPFYFRSIPDRQAFNDAIGDHVTLPLVGLVGTGLRDETLGAPNDRATRAVSHPPLVTPYAIHHAATELATPDTHFAEVYVVWVHAGERNYAITIPQKMIERDYGPHAADYYRASRLLYAITQDVVHTRTGELADGNVTVWKVRRVIENADPAEPTLVARGGPAALDLRRPTLDLSMFPPAATQWLRKFRIGNVTAEQWSIAYLDDRFRPIDALVRMQRSGKTYPLASPTASIPAGQIAVEADGKRETTEWNVADALVAEVRFEPVEELPDYLQQIAVSIPTTLSSPAAPITIAISAFPANVTKSIVAIIVMLILYGVYRTIRRFWKRTLALHVEWDGPTIDEIDLRGPNTEHVATARLWLLDQSSFRPVKRRKLNLVLTADTPITEIPLREASTNVSHFLCGGKPCTKIQLAIAPSRVPSGKGTAVPIRFDPSVVDFTRLRAGRALSGAYTFAVDLPAAGRYRGLIDHKSHRYRVAVQAFPPQYVVDGTLLEELERRGLFYDPKLTATEPQRRFVIGWVFVDNPPVPEGAALDIAVVGRVAAAARIGTDSESHEVPALAALSAADNGDVNREITIPNGGRERWEVWVTIPSGVNWGARTEWTISVMTTLHVRVADSEEVAAHHVPLECIWYPMNRNDFVCVDLGTSATRLLIQGSEDSRYGFLPFPDSVRGQLSEPEDLPAICHIEEKRVLFGDQALNLELDPAGFRTSLKQRLLEERDHSVAEIVLYLQRVLTEFYQPNVHETPPGQRIVELRQPRPDGAADIVTVMRGQRPLAVCSVPNEASPSLRTAYESAIKDTGLFRRVQLVREAEAVALDFIDRRHQLGGPAETFRILALDIGAGTSDAALVTAEIPRDREPSATVVAAAGVPRAGGHIDRTIFDVVAAAGRIAMKRDFAALDAVASDRYLRQCEKIKRAMAAGAAAIHVNFEGGAELDDLDAIFASPEYQKALYDIVDVPLKMLLGRLPTSATNKKVTYLLLTGRGSLIRGVRDRFLTATERIRTADFEFENASGDPGMLKAAVTLGARSFARKQWWSLHLANEHFPDRILLLAVNDQKTESIIVVDAGDEYKKNRIHREVPLDWNRWTRAAVIRTYLRPDAHFGADLHLDEDACRRVFAGLHVGPFAGAYTLLRNLRPPAKRQKRDWYAIVNINRNGEVSVREEAR